MSPLPSSEIRLGVFEGLCGALRWHGLGRRRRATVRTHGIGPEAGAGALGRALTSVSADLGPLRWPVRLVLGGGLNRYVVLAESPLLKSEADWYALARARAAQAYGGTPEAWRVTLSTRSHGVRVAAAIESARFDAIQAGLAQAKVKPARIVPYLSRAIGRTRRAAPIEGRHWVVVAEPGHLTALAMAGPRPERIAQFGAWNADIARLDAALVREEVLLGWPPGTADIGWISGADVLRLARSECAAALANAAAMTAATDDDRRDALVMSLLH